MKRADWKDFGDSSVNISVTLDNGQIKNKNDYLKQKRSWNNHFCNYKQNKSKLKSSYH